MNAARRESDYVAAHFEALEPRMMLDSQVGIVSMPVDGYLSAAVYDSSGALVRTLLARSAEQAGNVPLTWDGKNDLGQVVSQNGSYTWKALISLVQTVDQGGVGDSLFAAGDLSLDHGYNLQSLTTPTVGGTSGDVGGTFARNDGESYFGDTSLSQSYTLDSPFDAAGTVFISDPQTMNGKLFVGHFSSSTAGGSREFVGLEFENGDTDDWVAVHARVYPQDGSPYTGATSAAGLVLSAGSGYYNWEYSYDPFYEADAGHEGPEGRLWFHIYNNAGADASGYAVLNGVTRDAGATLDAFGMGIASYQGGVGDDPGATVKVFIDDVSYSGNTGVVDFTSDPGWSGSGNTAGGNDYGWNQYANADGSLYLASAGEETVEQRRLFQDGSSAWFAKSGKNYGVAADEKYVYFSKHIGDEDRIYRQFARDGGPAPFAPGVDYIVVNTSAPDPRPSDQDAIVWTPEQWRTLGSLWGMAADGHRIFVSNYRNNRIEVYDRNTGSKLGEYSMAKPLGIAVETSGSGSSVIWVANKGNSVSRFTFRSDAQGNWRLSEDISRRITGLADPSGVAIGGPDHHLFVAETASCQIRQYDIGNTVTPAGFHVFGSRHEAGTPLGDSEFYFWDTWAAIAVDPSGILSVQDDSRVQRFYTTGPLAGQLYQSMFNKGGVAPVDTFDYGADGLHKLQDQRFEYEVDPEYTGGPRSGWLGDGSWRLSSRYYYGFGPFSHSGGLTLRRAISDGQTTREFLYVFAGAGLVTYALEPTGPRMSAIVGSGWAGVDLMSKNTLDGWTPNGQYNWTDSDGDGLIDWNGVGSGMADGEVSWIVPLGQAGNYYTVSWVDEGGNIWITDSGNNIAKIPLGGFDAQGNPLYNWNARQTVVPASAHELGFGAGTVRVAASGDIYAMGGTSQASHVGVPNLPQGNFVAHYNSSGQLQLMQPTLDIYYGGLAIDETDPTPDYYYAGTGEGDQQYVSMFTNDGLLVARAQPGAASGYSSGWLDFAYGVGAFTHPITGKTYIYAEDCYFMKAERYRVDNLETIQRQQGSFSYTYAGGLTGHWEFEGGLGDSGVSGAGTFFGGAPEFVAGQVGNAIDLDGTDDYINVPGNRQDAYTIAAWIRPADVTSVSVFNGAGSGGGVFKGLRINASGKLEHFTGDNGLAKTVTGTTTLQANTWYHVAITAGQDGMMRLYVNGAEEGTALSIAGPLWLSGSGLDIGRSYSGTGFFDGLVDDFRVYDHVLGQAQVQAIYSKTDKPAVNVLASDATASEYTVDPGTFTIKRDNTGGNLTVHYAISGTAAGGSDYSAVPGSVVIAEGQTSATVIIAPLDDDGVEGNETVILTLSTNANYTVGAANVATITIVDNDGSSTVEPGGRWAFESNPADWAGANNGKYHGGAIGYSADDTYVPGRIGNALELTGRHGFYAGDYVDIPYATDASAYTIMAWVKASDVTAVAIIVRADDTGLLTCPTSQQIRINSSGKFEHSTYNGAYHTVTGTTTAQEDTWYHVAIVATSNGMARLYVNGEEEGTAVGVGDIWTGGDRFYVGRVTYGFEYLEGLVDDVQVFDAPLTASQIQAIYSQNAVSVTASDPSAAEQGPDGGTFTISRPGTSGDLTVYYTVGGTATSGADYSALAGSAVIADGLSSVTVAVAPVDDSTVEGSETVVLTLSSNANYTVATPNNAVVRIADNEAVVTVLAGDTAVSEQGVNTGTFIVSRSNTSGNLTVYYTVGGTAGSGWDFLALSGSVMIASGQASATVTITPIDDAVFDSGETVVLTLSTDPNYTVGTPDGASLVIFDNDALVTVVATDASAAEHDADTGEFTVTRTNASGDLTVNYTVGGTAGSGADYSALSGSVVIPSGQTLATVSLIPLGDAAIEGDESVILTLSASANYTVGSPGSATVNIADDDVEVPDPNGRWTFNNSLQDSLGSNHGTFFGGSQAYASGMVDSAIALDGIDDYVRMMYLSDPTAYTITAWVKPAAVAAANIIVRTDFQGPLVSPSHQIRIGANGKFEHLTFDGGLKTVIGTTTVQADTWYHVAIVASNNGMARLYVNGNEEGTAVGIGTLWTNGDRFHIGDASYGPMGFFEGLVDDVRVYEQALSTSQILAIRGQTGSTVTVSATDAYASERGVDGGTFTVTRGNTSGDMTVYYAVSGTASNGSDFSTLPGSVVIPNGMASAMITVTPINDSAIEGDESVSLTLLAGANYFIGSPSVATLSIADDDVIVPGPNGRWMFNSDLNDSAGSNNGTFAGGTAVYSAGMIGSAIDLDGSNDYVQVMYASDPTAYTITAWVKPTDTSAVNIIVRTDSMGPLVSPSHQIRINAGGKFEHSTYDQGAIALKAVTGTTTAQPDTWYHVAIVASNNGMARLYVNGQEEGTAVSINTLWTGGDRFQVGSAAYGSMGFFDGMVDDVRIYEQALNTSQIGVIVADRDIAFDGFESGTTSGGTGWGGNWTFTGNASIVTAGAPNNGSRHLQLTGNNGVASRAVNLAGVTNAHLVFDWKANSFEAGETAVIEIYNGTSWQTVLTISDGQDDNAYHNANIDLSGYTLTGSFQVRFRSLMSASDDYFYIDNVLVVM